MLKIDWNIIWTIVNVLVLFLFLKRFLFGPVTTMMEKRTKMIEDSFEEAKVKKEEAMALQKEYQKHLCQADIEAGQIIKNARNQAELEYHRIMLEAQEESERKIEEAKETIALERQKAMQSAQEEIAAIAILATTKLIQKNVDVKTNHQMFGEFIKEVGAIK